MNAKRCLLSTAIGCLVLWSAFSQTADPASVTPAWVMEQQFGQQTTETTETATNAFNVFFIGYDYPMLSGPLADDLAGWESPYNFSLGMESCSKEGSSFLTGIECEFFVTIDDAGSRFLMNDMVMLGYSFDLSPVRLNAGARVGLSILDVMGDSVPSYTGLGLVAGPEASVYVAIESSSWIWLRARYSLAYYIGLDAATPIVEGNDSLNCVSLEAGLAFRL